MNYDCNDITAGSQAERQVVRTALILNGLMFAIGVGAGIFAQSTSILADALDMAADASGYAMALLAIARGPHFRVIAARWTGGVLVVLGLGIIAEAGRRWFMGSTPLGPVMMGYSVVSFLVNLYVMGQLAKVREGGVHLNASYICTRADVLANIAVFVSGALVWLTGAHWIDLIAGAGIALFVFSEAREILEEAKEAAETG